jgi:hypothetical protein
MGPDSFSSDSVRPPSRFVPGRLENRECPPVDANRIAGVCPPAQRHSGQRPQHVGRGFTGPHFRTFPSNFRSLMPHGSFKSADRSPLGTSPRGMSASVGTDRRKASMVPHPSSLRKKPLPSWGGRPRAQRPIRVKTFAFGIGPHSNTLRIPRFAPPRECLATPSDACAPESIALPKALQA